MLVAALDGVGRVHEHSLDMFDMKEALAVDQLVAHADRQEVSGFAGRDEALNFHREDVDEGSPRGSQREIASMIWPGSVDENWESNKGGGCIAVCLCSVECERLRCCTELSICSVRAKVAGTHARSQPEDPGACVHVSNPGCRQGFAGGLRIEEVNTRCGVARATGRACVGG